MQSSDNPFLAIDQAIVGDVYTSTTVYDNLAVLCDEFGSRFGGTAGEEAAAAFLQEQFREYGLTGISAEPIEYIGWRRGDLDCRLTSPVERPLDAITLPHSPPANLEAELIDLGAGDPAAFDERADDIRGKIVMVSSANPTGVKRWVHRMEKYGRAVLAGAVGFVFVNHYPGYGPATGGIGRDSGGAGFIPAVSLSYEDGAFVQRLMKRGESVHLRIRSSDEIEPMTSWNVFAGLTGTDSEARTVLLGCHYDGHDIAQGATDPASGVVVVLEAARMLARHAPRAPHTIRFALWGIEEIGLQGSTHYVNTNSAEMDRIRFYLNLDMAGAINPKDIILNEWPDLEPLFRSWSAEMALPYDVGQSLSAHSDHFPFLLAGVPTGAIGTVKKSLSGRGYAHTKYDTLDKADLRSLREAAVLAARLALRIARVSEWPAQRRDPEAVQEKMLTDDGFVEERTLFDRLGAFYAQQAS